MQIQDEQVQPKCDKFGFFLEPKDKEEVYNPFIAKRDNARLMKWLQMIPKINSLSDQKVPKLRKRIRKGIPACLRCKVWPLIANLPKVKTESQNIFQDLLQKESRFENSISKDIYRTFPNHYFFTGQAPGVQSLMDVLKAVSLTFSEMGYCQGLNFIAAMLIMYCNDEDAYWIVSSLLKEYKLLEFFQDPGKLKKMFYVQNELLFKNFPKVCTHFRDNGVQPFLYATKWFMTLYLCVLPFNLVVRIFDNFLFESYKILYKVALAIFKIKQAALLNARDIEGIMELLRNFNEPAFQDEEAFFKLVFSIKVSGEEIERLERQYFKLNTN